MVINNSTHVPLAIAAQILSVSRTVAYDLVLTGRLKGNRQNGRWFVEARSLTQYREAQRKGEILNHA